MALTEELVVDKIEIVNPFKIIQIRMANNIKRNDDIISSSYQRYVLSPGDDISSQPEEIRAICNLVWTNDVITYYMSYKQNQI